MLIAGKRTKLMRCENLDEMEKRVNQFADEHQVAEIKVRPNNGKKPWLIFINFFPQPIEGYWTKKIKIITTTSTEDLERQMNMFANAFTADDFDGRILPAREADRMRGIEKYIGFIVFYDQLQI